MNANQITIGADPELFLYDTGRGCTVSAIGKVGGTKASPLPVYGGALQEDGVLAEINIEPSKNVQEFIFNIESVMQALQDKVGNGVQLRAISYDTLPEEELDDPAAWEIGCDPDLNAWTGYPNVPPFCYDDGTRVAGGHVHVGYENPSEEVSTQIVKMLDYCLGLPSLIEEPDTSRRKLYGQAGSCRFKPYGVEYRALGNYWLNSPEQMETVFNRTQEAVANLDKLPLLMETLDPDLLQDLINNGEDTEVIRAYYQDVRRILDETPSF